MNTLTGLVVQPIFAIACFALFLERDLLNTIDFQKAGSAISLFTLNTSFFMGLALAVDSYLAVSRPTKYKTLVTVKRAKRWTIFTLLYSFLYSLLPYLGLPVMVVLIVDVHLNSTLNSLLLLLSYILLFKAFRGMTRASLALRSSSRASLEVGKVLKLRRKSYKILFVVVVLSTGPAIFSTLSWYLSFYCEECACHKNASLRVAQIVFINMVLAKPAADPFAFAWRIPRYRQALRQTISCPFYRPPQMRHGKIAPMQMHRVEGDSATNTRDAARPQDIRPEGIQPEQTRRASTNGSMRWLLCISANLIPGERTSPEDSSKLKESRNTRLINKLCWRRPDLNRALRFDRSIARNPDKDKREDTNKFEETQERFDNQSCYRLPCS